MIILKKDWLILTQSVTYYETCFQKYNHYHHNHHTTHNTYPIRTSAFASHTGFAWTAYLSLPSPYLYPHYLTLSCLSPDVTGTTAMGVLGVPTMSPTKRSHQNLMILKFSSLNSLINVNKYIFT